jgi:Calcineurin-like phosphoesterase
MNAHLLPFPYNQSVNKSRLSTVYARLAAILYRIHQLTSPSPLILPSQSASVTIVCISDTHNATPSVPNGDVLIHAGDLTQHGTFAELQAQLDWLQSLPHAHKIVVAGNHDVLLDEAFAEKFPHRAVGTDGKTNSDLDWGDIIYLENSLTLPTHGGRELKVFGSPQTPELGVWAFQYPAIRDVWTDRIPEETEVVVVHGPPVLHGDVDKKGDGYLLRELRRVKPRLVVCGHVHDGHGESVLVHDDIESLAEEIGLGWRGFASLMQMLLLILCSWLRMLLGIRAKSKVTRIINAAVAPSEKHKRQKSAIVVQI